MRLERIDGLTLHIRDVDLVDGTPVLDIKPYVPYTDAYPDAATGWLHDEALAVRARRAAAQTPPDPITAWTVHFDPLAAEQAAWIEARTGLPLRERITATLMLGPQPHAYRRIRRDGADYRLKVKEWRVRFSAGPAGHPGAGDQLRLPARGNRPVGGPGRGSAGRAPGLPRGVEVGSTTEPPYNGGQRPRP